MFKIGDDVRVRPRIYGIRHTFKSFTTAKIQDVIIGFEPYYEIKANGKTQFVSGNEIAPINQENINFN